jgi:hypothetical protein
LKNLNVSQPLSGGSPTSRFQAAKAMAFTLALAAPEMLEPELIAWKDRTTSMASPELEGCSGPYGWRDYGISHDGRLEVDVGGEAIFIFTESSPYDSCEHFGHGLFVNLRDDRDNDMICRVGGVACMPLDEWTSKLT